MSVREVSIHLEATECTLVSQSKKVTHWAPESRHSQVVDTGVHWRRSQDVRVTGSVKSTKQVEKIPA